MPTEPSPSLLFKDASMAERFLGLRAWAEQRFGKPADQVTIADVEQQMPHRTDLQDPPFTDSLGGRVRFHLESWPSQDEAQDLARRAERFHKTV